MCGIVGYVGSEARAQDVIMDGLRRLEYRGYDSSGIALLDAGKLRIIRCVGKLINLESALRDVPARGPIGIGHTRWATHGRPSEQNAHPHRAGTIAIAHNGIVENYRELRDALARGGATFHSETDTEVIAHLIHAERRAGRSLLDAVRAAVAKIDGTYALAVIDEEDPSALVAAKNGGSPVILGMGRGENFVASDIPAILPYTRTMVPLHDGDVAYISRDSVQVLDARGHSVQRAPLQVLWDPIHAEKGGYEHFMQKEIHEQPRAITQTIGTRAIEETGEIDLDGIDLGKTWAREMRGVQIVGCGTASYAGMVGRDLLERFAKVSAQVDLAHEFRYREPLLTASHLAVPISQSGETADTLGALRMARECGAKTLCVTNSHGSSIARESDHVLYTHAGPEIGVASTKCFTAQITALFLLALKLGLLRDVLKAEESRRWIVELRRLPRAVDEAVSRWSGVEQIARAFHHHSDFLFLGRGVGYPIALEGALKLKEISYIHAEGYASGEIKHGPIALIQEGTPVVIVANQPSARAKLISTAEEVRARGARVIAVAEDGDDEMARHADYVLRVPPTPEPLCAVVATVPLQILAYQIAKLRGTDVDQPRNLAKSVTVE